MKSSQLEKALSLVNQYKHFDSCADKVQHDQEISISLHAKSGSMNKTGFSTTIKLTEKDVLALKEIFIRHSQLSRESALGLGVEFD